MKNITKEITPTQFVHDVLPWFVKHSDAYVEYIVVGTYNTGLPYCMKSFVLTLNNLCEEICNGPIWEAKVLIPPISSITPPISDNQSFIQSDYQIFIHYFDCRYLSVWFKEDSFAVDFLTYCRTWRT